MSQNKIMNEYLIAAVERRPSLWQASHKSHKNKLLNAALWLEVAAEVLPSLPSKEGSDLAQKRWKSLRDKFRRICQAATDSKKSGAEAEVADNEVAWQYFESLHFLKDTVHGRPNFPIHTESLLHAFCPWLKAVTLRDWKRAQWAREQTTSGNYKSPKTSQPASSCVLGSSGASRLVTVLQDSAMSETSGASRTNAVLEPSGVFQANGVSEHCEVLELSTQTTDNNKLSQFEEWVLDEPCSQESVAYTSAAHEDLPAAEASLPRTALAQGKRHKRKADRVDEVIATHMGKLTDALNTSEKLSYCEHFGLPLSKMMETVPVDARPGLQIKLLQAFQEYTAK